MRPEVVVFLKYVRKTVFFYNNSLAGPRFDLVFLKNLERQPMIDELLWPHTEN